MVNIRKGIKMSEENHIPLNITRQPGETLEDMINNLKELKVVLEELVKKSNEDNK